PAHRYRPKRRRCDGERPRRGWSRSTEARPGRRTSQRRHHHQTRCPYVGATRRGARQGSEHRPRAADTERAEDPRAPARQADLIGRGSSWVTRRELSDSIYSPVYLRYDTAVSRDVATYGHFCLLARALE